jgi:hypothetical protein
MNITGFGNRLSEALTLDDQRLLELAAVDWRNQLATSENLEN